MKTTAIFTLQVIFMAVCFTGQKRNGMPAYFYFNLLDFLKQAFFKSPVAPYGQTMEVGGIKEKKSTFKDTESNPKNKNWKYLVLKTALIFVPA